MSDQVEEPPVTGDASVDEALAAVAQLGDQPLDQCLPVLRQAQEKLQSLLDSVPDQI
jgi:hypothetical protein